jgi:hypothetical protein
LQPVSCEKPAPVHGATGTTELVRDFLHGQALMQGNEWRQSQKGKIAPERPTSEINKTEAQRAVRIFSVSTAGGPLHHQSDPAVRLPFF